MNEILVCGGRLYATGPNYYQMERIFDQSMVTLRDAGEFSIVCGDASGADGYARHWAKQFGVECQVFRADWANLGKSAGPKRNQRMLDESDIALVVAFPGGRGTLDMVRRARAAKIPVWEPLVETTMSARQLKELILFGAQQ